MEKLLERKWKSFFTISCTQLIHSTKSFYVCVFDCVCVCLKYRRQFLSRLRVAFMSPLNKYNISCVLLLITWNPIYCHCQCFMSCYVAWFDLKKSIFDFMKLCYLPNFSSCIWLIFNNKSVTSSRPNVQHFQKRQQQRQQKISFVVYLFFANVMCKIDD